MHRSIFKRDNTEDISLSVERLLVRPGQLVAVTGVMGAGKSTFLLALLNELKLVSGTSCTNGSTAYVGQIPWIMGSSLKENIMFGKAFDEALYTKTLAICCLEKDIDGMNERDSTVVSDQGTTLSGGQRARVGLARAFYAEADIYVLDDTLAALDVMVQTSIWNNML
ncbi:P-loop containing nucleoside triphosphate hydrolase protein, partial [Coemansia reversa NRRL 1564]